MGVTAVLHQVLNLGIGTFIASLVYAIGEHIFQLSSGTNTTTAWLDNVNFESFWDMISQTFNFGTLWSWASDLMDHGLGLMIFYGAFNLFLG